MNNGSRILPACIAKGALRTSLQFVFHAYTGMSPPSIWNTSEIGACSAIETL